MRTITRHFFSVLMLAAALAVGCGKSGAPGSPVAPTGTQPASSGASLGGYLVVGAAPPAAAGAYSTSAASGAARITITIVGTSITTTSNDDGSFQIQSVPPGDLTLALSGNGVAAKVLVVGVEDRARVNITIRLSGGTAELEEAEHVSDTKAEVEGQVVSVNGNSIVVGQRARVIIVPAGTPIRHGNEARLFSDLVPGVRVHVRATRSGDTLTATEVLLQNERQVPAGGRGGDTDDSDDDDGGGAGRGNGNGGGNGNGAGSGGGSGRGGDAPGNSGRP